MTDPFRKVHSGETIQVAARTWNGVMDAARAHSQGQLSEAGLIPGSARDCTRVKVRNSSGSDRERFEVLAIGDVIITPEANETEFLRAVLVEGVEPDAAHSVAFVVLLQPLKTEEIGWAQIAGTIPALLSITSADDVRAGLEPGEYRLQTGGSGAARIVWKEEGTGDKWGLVEIGQPVGLSLVGKAAQTIAPDSNGTVTVYQQGSGSPAATEILIEVYNTGEEVEQDEWVHVSIDVFGKAWITHVDSADNESCKQSFQAIRDITQISGWSGSVVQFLGHDTSGCLKWYSTTPCP